jgi:membrane-associated phospholipid phosphatase
MPAKLARVSLVLVLVVGARTARGEEPREPPPPEAAPRTDQPGKSPAPENELAYSWTIDGAVTAGAVVVWGGSQLLASHLAASTCRWCNPGSLDSSVRDALRWNDTSAALLASNLDAFGFVPLASLGLLTLGAAHDDRLGEMSGNGLVIAEAVALSGALNQVVKFAAGRERPYVHALPPTQKALTGNPADNNTSFYSGHTSFAFSLAVASGTVASMRHYRLAWAVWAAGLAGAATVGYLRIAADRHYFTDVLAGAVVGSGIGFAVPYAFHRPRARDVAGHLTVVPAPGGGATLLFATSL